MVRVLLMSVPEPLIRRDPATNPPHVHDIDPLPVPKPSPPAPTVGNQPEVTSPLVARPSSHALPTSPHEPAPTNLSWSASPPSQEVRAVYPKQGFLFDRIRAPRSNLDFDGMSSPRLPIDAAPLPPRDQSSERAMAPLKDFENVFPTLVDRSKMPSLRAKERKGRKMVFTMDDEMVATHFPPSSVKSR